MQPQTSSAMQATMMYSFAFCSRAALWIFSSLFPIRAHRRLASLARSHAATRGWCASVRLSPLDLSRSRGGLLLTLLPRDHGSSARAELYIEYSRIRERERASELRISDARSMMERDVWCCLAVRLVSISASPLRSISISSSSTSIGALKATNSPVANQSCTPIAFVDVFSPLLVSTTDDVRSQNYFSILRQFLTSRSSNN